MAETYSLILNLQLKDELSTIETTMLHYLINGNGNLPEALPAHEIFQSHAINQLLIKDWYRGFYKGWWQSQFWIHDDELVHMKGVNLLLPGHTLESVLTEPLALAQWLAAISKNTGYVGAITSDDDSDGMPLCLLFIRNNRLYISDLPDVLDMKPANGIQSKR